MSRRLLLLCMTYLGTLVVLLHHINQSHHLRVLLDEITTTFPDWKSRIAQDGLPAVPDYDTLVCMPYLNRFLNEVLQYYPAAAFTRKATRDVV
ncbi:hypothetical protein BJ742DRAFT_798662 [Cladochytrium replicatum]|nr:hypothetical protein BJ742DRAFT_798662 [Cladochytrium replicatum]